MLSHQLQRHRLDGGKQIIQNPGERQRQDLEKTEIEKHEVYAIDVIFSTGKGVVPLIKFYFSFRKA